MGSSSAYYKDFSSRDTAISEAIENQARVLIRGEQAFFSHEYISNLMINEIKIRIEKIRNNHCS